ncbi:hypothetical protein ABK040_005866 [Willaertia magna]
MKGKSFYNIQASVKLFTKLNFTLQNEDIKFIRIGYYFLFIITKNNIYAYGNNYNGQLGLNSYLNADQLTIVNLNNINNIKDLQCNKAHSILLDNLGSYCTQYKKLEKKCAKRKYYKTCIKKSPGYKVCAKYQFTGGKKQCVRHADRTVCAEKKKVCTPFEVEKRQHKKKPKTYNKKTAVYKKK